MKVMNFESLILFLQRGLLRTHKGDYFIEPVKGYNHTEDAHHPHLIYKRSALPDDMHVPGAFKQHKHHHKDGTCGVSGRLHTFEDSRFRDIPQVITAKTISI